MQTLDLASFHLKSGHHEVWCLAALLPALRGVAVAEDTVGEASGLPEPLVLMEADPSPPFTYWAPEGSTIINHPNGGGVWIAGQNGERAAFYFGDQCRASEFQGLVGQPLDSFAADDVGKHLRTACTECAATSDLRFNRVNVWFDQDTSIIEEISCGLSLHAKQWLCSLLGMQA